MSQYLHIFSRKDKEFISLYCESSNGSIYRYLCQFAPWEKIAKLDFNKISIAIDNVEYALANEEIELEDINKRISFLEKSAVGTLAEKIEEFESYWADLREVKDLKKSTEEVLVKLKFIREMVEQIDSDIKYESCSKESGIYIGIECGVNVTEKDIEE